MIIPHTENRQKGVDWKELAIPGCRNARLLCVHKGLQHSKTSVISNIMLKKILILGSCLALSTPFSGNNLFFFFFFTSKHKKKKLEYEVHSLKMPGNIRPTFYSYLSQEDFLQMQHKYVQAIILTRVGPLAYSLAWTLASHVGVREEINYSSLGEGKLRNEGTKSSLSLPWILQGAEPEPRAPSASHPLCLSQGNSESWNNGPRVCLLLLLVASCYRRFQHSPALLGGGSFHVPEGFIKDLTFQTQFCA